MKILKKLLCLTLCALCFCSVFLLIGCTDKKKKDEIERGRYNLLAYARVWNSSGFTSKFLCELTEENNVQTIELPVGQYTIYFEPKCIEGPNWAGIESWVTYHLDSYTSPEGETMKKPPNHLSDTIGIDKGTYVYICDIAKSTKYYGLYTILYVEIV